jgi:DNA-3-methyladenine glycosylase II
MDGPHDYLSQDPRLGPVVEAHGPLSLEPSADPFRRLIVSIVRQQVSMDSAAAIRERLFDAVEITPAGIQAADDAVLQEAGLSAAKTEYVNAVAAYFQETDVESFHGMDDAAVLEELTEIRGIGPWTAKMFLLFGLARPDVFPVEDLGIRKGMRALYDRDLDRAAMYEEAERWRPYRSYAARYIWRGYEAD